MKHLTSYTYTVLRYVHDITTGEFVNVGVALYAPEQRYIGALCRPTYGRLNKVFPGINAEYFKSLMRHIQFQFEKLGEEVATELPLKTARSVLELAHGILPHDDSALQWSPAGAGRTDDPALTLERLFDRMVMRYEDKPSKEGRSEDEVWRHFKRNLETRHLLRYFAPKKVSVSDDEYEFQHAWKNGAWHCLEPLSFDLTTPGGIKDKAHRWLGTMTSIAQAPEELHLYMLIGQPQGDKLSAAFDNALSILRKVPVKSTIYLEQDADALANKIAKEVEEHSTSAKSPP